MTTSMPTTLSYGVLSVVPGGNAQVDLPGDSTPDWSLGFWVRLKGPSTGGIVAEMGAGSFYPNVVLTGRALGFGLPGVTVVGSIEVELGVWHYVVLSTSASLASVLSIDGVVAATSAGLPPMVYEDNFNSLSLGYGVEADFLSVAIWNRVLADDERVGAVNQPPVSAGLVSYFDFSNPLSANSFSMNPGMYPGARICAVDPGLLCANGVALPDPSDGLTTGTGADASFTIMAWVNASVPLTEIGQGSFLTVLSNGAVQAPGAFVFGLDYQASTQNFKLSITVNGMTAAGGTVPSGWHHIALCYSSTGNVITYIDGVTQTMLNFPPISAGQAIQRVVIGGQADDTALSGYSRLFVGYLQGVSIWNAVLSQGQVQDSMIAGPVPDIAGCVAYFDLASVGLINQITGSRLSLLGQASLVSTETPSSALIALPARSTDAPAGSGPIAGGVPQVFPPAPSPEAAAQLAAVDDRTEPPCRLLAPGQAARIKQHFEQVLLRVPDAVRPALRQKFLRNLHRGMAEADLRTDPPQGSFRVTTVGGEYIMHYYGADGPVEALRLSAATVDPCTMWIIQVTATAVGLALSALGVAFYVNTLASAVARLMAQDVDLAVAIGRAIQEYEGANQVIAVVRYLVSQGKFAKTVAACMAGISWWRLCFAVASLLVTLALIFASGGVYLAMFLANLALNIIAMVDVVNQKPSGC